MYLGEEILIVEIVVFSIEVFILVFLGGLGVSEIVVIGIFRILFF